MRKKREKSVFFNEEYVCKKHEYVGYGKDYQCLNLIIMKRGRI